MDKYWEQLLIPRKPNRPRIGAGKYTTRQTKTAMDAKTREKKNDKTR
jgi:hypothetical protein